MLFDKPSLYFIMGTENCGGKEPLVLLGEALEGGIDWFQLREKGNGALTDSALETFAKECQALCQAYSVPFIINDDVELACRIDADGVHVGQDDMNCAEVRRRIGEDKIVGVSVHSVVEAERAKVAGADYVGMGPVYGTQTKSDAKKPAGTEGIRSVSLQYPELPIVGIGGITPENAGAVWEAGASSVAVISSLAQAANIKGQIQRFRLSCKGGAPV